MAKDWTKEDLQRQAMAAASLVAELNANIQGAEGDDELAHDTVEGETNFFEACEKALDEIDACQIIVDGCEASIKRTTDRKNRAKKRIENLKGMLDQAFQMAEIKTHQFPTATISTKRVPPKVLITDESAIPARFWKVPDPVLDKTELNKAVKEGKDTGESIPGVTLSNGGQTIQIRKG